MIFITGDCHGDFCRFDENIFTEQCEMTKDDCVIICGDFGGVWNKDTESESETERLDWLESRPFTTLFVDGNHENFDRLDAYPTEIWNGGRVHRIRDSVIHLMRGQVFELEGCSFFTFGGASSHDTGGGILEPDDPDFEAKRLELGRRTKMFRINHLSWWSRELPSLDEMEEGWKNLERYRYKVDFVVSHCCSSSTQMLISGGLFKPDRLTVYLEEIQRKITFKKWFFGHYHNDFRINAQQMMLFEQIVRIH